MRRILVSTTVFAVLAIALPATAGSERGVDLERVIVQLQEDGPEPGSFADDVISAHGGRMGFIYQHAVKGFSAELPAAAITALDKNPQVVAVTPDVRVAIAATDLDVPTGFDRIEADLAPRSSGNADVDVAVIDTGVRLYHPDLNVWTATNCTVSLFGGCSPSDLEDGHGHGTHVAGIIGAKANGTGTTGVAPGARIWSVKVLGPDGSGFLSWILSGVDVVTEHAAEIDVANMSLAGVFSNSTFDTAISNSVAAGVTYVVAAGNDAADAGTYSPANHPEAVAVSAVADADGAGGGLGVFGCRQGETDDHLASFSNWGEAVDAAAPGVCIYSTWKDDGYRTLSGTSMASPLVAGTFALEIAERGRDRDGDGDYDAADVGTLRTTVLGNSVAEGAACGYVDTSGDGFGEPMVIAPGVSPTSCVVAAPDTTPPSTVNLTVTSGGFEVDLAWTASTDPESGILGYEVRRDGSTVVHLDAHETGYTDTGLAPSTSYTYEVIPTNRQGVSGAASSGSGSTSDGDVSLAGWFPLDDGSGTVATDASGWGRDGSLRNGATWTEGMTGGAVALDGTDDRIDLLPATADGFGDITYAVWLRSSKAGVQALVSGANGGNTNEFTVMLLDPTRIRFYTGTSINAGVEASIENLADGTWHHLAVVRNDGLDQVYFYVDGAWSSGWQISQAMEPVQIEGLVLGQNQHSVGGSFSASEAFAGEFDDVRFYSRVLSGSEIAALAAAGSSNLAPQAGDVAIGGPEDSSIGWTPSVVDPEADPLTCTVVDPPASGTATVGTDCSSGQYVPDPDFNGSDSFTYRTNDGTVDSNLATVTVMVTPVNDAPVAVDDSYTTPEGTALTVAAPGVLGNDSDVDGDPLTAALVAAPAGGTVTLNADGSLAYAPNPGFSGADSFTYRTNDGTLDSSLATATVAVTPAPTTIHVGDLDGAANAMSRWWWAQVTVLILDSDGTPVASSAVSGVWNGTSGETACITSTVGTCTLDSGPVRGKGKSSVTFSVSGVSHPSYAYDASQNTDPDGDSDGMTIVVLRQ